ncbi:hypothetical protein EPUS_01071 [Endocarpon pusillum Z07020]|uniref:Uncharacterized protein n=1 Tax=Endocarpon pusillum (strain Z07020 / HMAS-L-300199) TaxID=1263415 RepID=U1HG70_ENDPU|nr:uncharacterized protein EPUS_01071 [Endocarpon pusillum Z07020]ERF69115.1 hypothetical protein EPUS_01071 [Endocarpon pusillum Z07020]
MPSTIHDLTAEAIGDLIKSQLAAIGEKTSNEVTKRLIHEITPRVSRHVQLGGPKTFREPDKQFLIKGFYYPGIIIEFAYSQSFEQLRQKAYDFTVRSGGRVQLVIGLETGNKKLFKISAWRPEFCRSENRDAVRMKTITDQDIIRDSNGTLKPGCLRFHLRDFGRDLATNYPGAHLAEEIALDYDVLAGYLIDAEQCDVPPSPDADIIMSEYSFSSEEELTPEDEKKIILKVQEWCSIMAHDQQRIMVVVEISVSGQQLPQHITLAALFFKNPPRFAMTVGCIESESA